MILIVRASTRTNNRDIVEPWDLLIDKGLQGVGYLRRREFNSRTHRSCFAVLADQVPAAAGHVRCEVQGHRLIRGH